MRKGWLLMFCIAAGVYVIGCEEERSPALEISPLPEVEPKPGPVISAALGVEYNGEYGPYIADSDGRALYLLKGEVSGEIDCYAACAQVWRPFIAPQGSPTAADPNVQANLIGVIRRDDGSMQVTYNGHPLYYYVRDLGPEQTTGQDVHDAWGEWYLVTPEGQPLEEEQQESADTADAPGDNFLVTVLSA